MYIAAFRRALQQIGLGPLYDALLALEPALAGISATPTSPITVTYVASNGSDTTGTRGNIFKPFLTVQAALLAVVSGDVIEIAPAGPPGTRYAENLVVPAALLEVTLRGPAEISPATGVALTYTPTGARGILNIDDVTIKTRDPNPAINAVAVTGTASADPEVYIKDSTIGRSKFTDLVFATLDGVETVAPPVFINNQDVFVGACFIEGTMSVTYDDAVATRPRGDSSVVMSTLNAGVELVGEPVFLADQATRIEQGAVLAIDATALGITAARAPDITINGSVTGPCVFAFRKTTGASRNVLDLTGAEFFDTVTVSVNAADVNRAQVTADNTVLRGTVTVGESVDLEASNASISQPIVGVGSGAANRPIPDFVNTSLLLPFPTSYAVAISPPMIDANYQVAVTATDVATPVAFVVAGSQTTTGYDVAAEPTLFTGVGKCDSSVVRN